ncbi:MAG: trehalose-phosphatase [Gemmatimonadota bacterium]
MRSILSVAGREVVKELAWSNLLLGFDFDGTLAPIVTDPDAAALRPDTKALLRNVAGLYPCLVLSGRARADVVTRLDGTTIGLVLGNHGLEPWQARDDMSHLVAGWRAVLERRLGPLPGVMIEDKNFTLAIHYRRSRTKRAARAAILAVATELEGVRVIGGKQVINLVPAGGPTKGTAFLEERARAGCDTAIFVGDDDTDEDVFMLEQPGRLVTVRVGRKATSAASYYLPRQRDINELLGLLIAARMPPLRSRS